MPDHLEFLRRARRLDPSQQTESFFAGLLEAVNVVLPSTVSSLWIHNAYDATLTATALRLPDAWPPPLPDFQSIVQVRSSLTGRLVSEALPYLVVPDVTRERSYVNHALAARYGLKQALLIPVRHATSPSSPPSPVAAVINLYPTTQLPESLPKEIIELVELISIESAAILREALLSRHAEITSRLIEPAEVERGFASYLDVVVRLIARAVDAEGCSVFLLNEQDQVFELQSTTASCSETEKRAVRYKPGEGLTGGVGISGRPLIIRDLRKENVGNIFLEVDRRRALTFIAVPIFGPPRRDMKRQPIGVLRCVQKGRDTGRGFVLHFSANDQNTLELAASIVGLIHENRQANMRMEDVLQDISHEVRTPLSGILGRADALRQSAQRTQLPNKEFFEVKLKDVGDMTQLVIILIEGISTLYEGAGAYRFSPTFVFSEVVIKWCKLLEPVAQQKNMNIRYEGDIPRRLMLDRRRFEQVVYNLLSNAIKYGHNGTEILVEGWSESDQYVLSVRNYGIPVPAGFEELIFLKGFRAEMAKTKFPIGKGLGLAIVKRVLENHGAKVALVNSAMPTEFAIYLPKSLETRPPR